MKSRLLRALWRQVDDALPVLGDTLDLAFGVLANIYGSPLFPVLGAVVSYLVFARQWDKAKRAAAIRRERARAAQDEQPVAFRPATRGSSPPTGARGLPLANPPCM